MKTTQIGKRFGIEPAGRITRNRQCAFGRRQNTTKYGQQSRLTRSRRAHQQRQFTCAQIEGNAFQGAHRPGAMTKVLDDVAGNENGRMCHRANTMAGSMRVTLLIAAIAETAHMNSVRPNSSTAKPPVIMIGNGSAILSVTKIMSIAIIMPRT